MKKLTDIAKEILGEIKVNNPNEIEIPEGWTEQEVTIDDQVHHPDAKDEADDWYEKLNIYSAPMEGWDEDHSDVVQICRDKEGKYFVSSYYAFGTSQDSKKFNSFYEAKKYAVDEMEALMEDWDTEYDNDEEEEEED